MSRTRTGDPPTSAPTTARSHTGRLRPAEMAAPAARAMATAAATGTVWASLKVDAVNRLDRLSTVMGNPALLARALAGGGIVLGTPASPRAPATVALAR